MTLYVMNALKETMITYWCPALKAEWVPSFPVITTMLCEVKYQFVKVDHNKQISAIALVWYGHTLPF